MRSLMATVEMERPIGLDIMRSIGMILEEFEYSYLFNSELRLEDIAVERCNPESKNDFTYNTTFIYVIYGDILVKVKTIIHAFICAITGRKKAIISKKGLANQLNKKLIKQLITSDYEIIENIS